MLPIEPRRAEGTRAMHEIIVASGDRITCLHGQAAERTDDAGRSRDVLRDVRPMRRLQQPPRGQAGGAALLNRHPAAQQQRANIDHGSCFSFAAHFAISIRSVGGAAQVAAAYSVVVRRTFACDFAIRSRDCRFSFADSSIRTFEATIRQQVR